MRLKLVLAASVFALGAAGHAAAQEDPRDAIIRQLTQRLDALEQQVADLKESSSADVADVRSIISTAPQATLTNGRPTLATADGQLKFAVRGLVQFDSAEYDQKNKLSSTDLTSGTNFRRARLGVEGTVGKNWNYALTGEFGGSGSEAPVLNAGWVEYAGWKPWTTTQGQPVRLRIGAWASPTNLEDATNNTEGLFLERPASAELSRSIAGGDGRSGVGVLLNGDRWYAHAVYTGAVPGTANPAEFDEQSGFLLRAAWLPIQTPTYALHVGVNATGVIKPADTSAGAATTEQLRLRERPELRVDGTRFVDTGAINADSLLQTGAELGGYYKNLYVAGEVFSYKLDRSAVGRPDATFGGWYAQAAWAFTREQRLWVPATGGFRGIRPTKPFDPANGGWGAWELAARYSVLDLNDLEGAAGTAIATNGVRGGEQRITTLGLNWYPNQTVRFILNYQNAQVDRLNNAGAQIGEDFHIISLRSQFSF